MSADVDPYSGWWFALRQMKEAIELRMVEADDSKDLRQFHRGLLQNCRYGLDRLGEAYPLAHAKLKLRIQEALTADPTPAPSKEQG